MSAEKLLVAIITRKEKRGKKRKKEKEKDGEYENIRNNTGEKRGIGDIVI